MKLGIRKEFQVHLDVDLVLLDIEGARNEGLGQVHPLGGAVHLVLKEKMLASEEFIYSSVITTNLY